MNKQTLVLYLLRIILGLSFLIRLLIIQHHWLGNRDILSGFLISILILYIFRYYWKESKNLHDHIRLGVVISYCTSNILAMNKIPGSQILSIIFIICGLLFLFYSSVSFLSEILSKLSRNQKVLFQICWIMSLPLLLVGALFKIQHYPGASLMLMISSLILAALPVLLIFFDETHKMKKLD